MHKIIYLAVVSEDDNGMRLGILPRWLLTLCFIIMSAVNFPVTGIILTAMSTMFVSLTIASIFVNALVWAIRET